MNCMRVSALMGTIVALGCGSADSGARTDVTRIDPESIQAIRPDVGFLSIREIVLTEGTAWVLDGESPHLTRVSLEDGTALHTAQEGDGPGELRNPWAMQPSGEGGVRIWDFGTGRVSSFDSRGAFAESENLSAEIPIKTRLNIRDVSYVDPFRIRSNGNSVLVGSFPGRVTGTADFSFGTLRKADLRLTPGPELVRFSDHIEEGMASRLEWSAVPLWDALMDVIALWSPSSSQVIWMDEGGRPLTAVSVEWPETEINRKDIERYLLRMARVELGADQDVDEANITRMARAVRDRFAENHPGPVDLRLGSDGVVWLRLFDTTIDPLGKGGRWLRISRAGVQEAYEFPESFVPMVFLAHGAYGISRLRNGDQVLAWWSRSDLPHKLDSK